MKLRLSNEVDWAAEFVAHDSHSLQSGCRLAWKKFTSDYGIAPGQKLYLHFWNGKNWCSSGQIELDGKIKIPPTPHIVDRIASNNDWPGLFNALLASHNHAMQVEDLLGFVSLDDDDGQRCRDIRKKHFKVIK